MGATPRSSTSPYSADGREILRVARQHPFYFTDSIMGQQAKLKMRRRQLRTSGASTVEWIATQAVIYMRPRKDRREIGIAAHGVFDSILFPTRGMHFPPKRLVNVDLHKQFWAAAKQSAKKAQVDLLNRVHTPSALPGYPVTP